MKRKRLTWKADVPRADVQRPRQLVHEEELLPDNAHRAERLIVGALWSIEKNQLKLEFDGRTTPPPFPYLVPGGRSFSSLIVAHVGTPAVYMGTTRVEEMGRGSMMVRVLRHTFLINGLRYLVTDLNTLAPL